MNELIQLMTYEVEIKYKSGSMMFTSFRNKPDMETCITEALKKLGENVKYLTLIKR